MDAGAGEFTAHMPAEKGWPTALGRPRSLPAPHNSGQHLQAKGSAGRDSLNSLDIPSLGVVY